MAAQSAKPGDDVLHHTQKIKRMLEDVITHAREDIDKVSEPRAQALFETTAEVLIGLKTAYEHYDAGKEKAFRRDPKTGR